MYAHLLQPEDNKKHLSARKEQEGKTQQQEALPALGKALPSLSEIALGAGLTYKIHSPRTANVLYHLSRTGEFAASGRLQNIFLRYEKDETQEASITTPTTFIELLAIIVSENKDVILTNEVSSIYSSRTSPHALTEIGVEDGFKLLQVFQLQGVEPLIHYSQRYEIFNCDGVVVKIDYISQLGTYIKFNLPYPCCAEELIKKTARLRECLGLADLPQTNIHYAEELLHKNASII